ncbi:MAG: sirohydrochlorin chelatase [Candidatus Sumerlaeaceae bacterium]
MTQTALLVIVHGSPREESNDDVRRVLDHIREGGKYDQVQAAFLDCNEPDIPTAVRQCVEAGARRIVCVPYFLHSGRHVALDIPQILQQCASTFPHVEIFLSPLIGSSAVISQILRYRARQAVGFSG